MEQYIKKSALVAEIEKAIKIIYAGREYVGIPYGEECIVSGLQKAEDIINTLEVKEVNLELITGWFDHIAQIADDRMTLTNQRMTDAHALDEIKCLAKNSSEFITKHYKAQKGE